VRISWIWAHDDWDGPSIMKSVFDGTWRPRYEAPGPDALPDRFLIADGIFECQSCQPPYRVAADGREHAIDGNSRFERLSVAVVDELTVRTTGRRGGATTYESTMVVAQAGNAMTETRTAAMKVGEVVVPITSPMTGGADSARRPVLFQLSSVRVGAATTGAHLLSGSWRVVEVDLLNHEEDTIYRVVDDSLTMSDGLGRSYTASLDGSIAPYHGDPRFDRVSVQRIDERTIEESNLKGGAVLQITRWRVDPDGVTMHVRFDDTHGHVMEQTGYRV
jgi:hypothetical protein